jgi:WD40 repeat protein
VTSCPPGASPPATVPKPNSIPSPDCFQVPAVLLAAVLALSTSPGRGSTTVTNFVTSGNPVVSPNGPNNVTIVPKGEYAAIDTKPIEATMLKLRNTVGHENDDLIHDIEQHSDKYAPPVFFVLADLLYRQGNLPDAIFWFNAGRLRAEFDAARCADVSARDAVSVLVMETPVDLRKAQFNNVDQLRSIIQKVIQWDATTPYNYDYRWINLHGMNAMESGLGQTVASSQPLSLPESTWTGLAKKNREDYAKGLEEAVAQVEKKKAEGIVDGAATNSVYNVPATSPPPAGVTPSSSGPGMTFKQTINFGGLGFGFGVRYLAFSPDGRYLAVLGSRDFVRIVLIVWDMASGREQSRIDDIGGAVGGDIRNPLVWGPNDSYITLAAGRREVATDRSSPMQITLWNPFTGEKIRDVEVSGGYGSLSPDGTRLAMVTGAMGHTVVRIYDTHDWTSQDYNADGLRLALGSLCWTAKGKAVIVGSWDRRFPLPELGSLKPADILAREIDPSGQQPPRTVLLAPSQPAPPPSTQFVSSLTPLREALDDHGNKIAVGQGIIKVFSGESLQPLFTYSPANLAEGAFGEIAFSPDGKYLYIMDTRTVGQGQSVILDAQTGKQIGSFPSGTAGFSISPDGRRAALGDEGAVKIFALFGTSTPDDLSPPPGAEADTAIHSASTPPAH